MVNIRQIVRATPLIVRVVLLYAVTATLLLGYFALTRSQQEATASVVQQQALPRYESPRDGKTIISGIPDRIMLDRLSVDLPVQRGEYDEQTKEWSLNDEAAFFVTTTSLPNDNKGNTFIYGHNNQKIFGSLASVVVGDLVTIQTTNGHSFVYQYRDDSVVTPSSTEVLDSNPTSPTLTIMTCDGLWSEGRRLMYFDLVEVS